jgi:carbon-monoxide dehydrogenase medium subunit
MIGGPQVRNTATIGGNVAHALPAADGSIALMALDATVEIVSSAGTRRLPMADLFLGPGKSILHHGSQILTGFYINLRQSGQASAFRRIMRPQGVAIAILNVAVWLQRNGDILDDIRISIGPSGPVPRRLSAMEMALRGRDINVESLSDAKSAMLNETNFRTSRHRSTREYRQDMAEVLFEETLLSAFKSAKGG